MRDSLPGVRGFNWSAIAVVLTILTMGAGLVAQWTTMTEARRNAETRDIDQVRQITALETRVHALETSREVERRIGELAEALARVEAELAAMRRDIRGRR